MYKLAKKPIEEKTAKPKLERIKEVKEQADFPQFNLENSPLVEIWRFP